MLSFSEHFKKINLKRKSSTWSNNEVWRSKKYQQYKIMTNEHLEYQNLQVTKNTIEELMT